MPILDAEYEIWIPGSVLSELWHFQVLNCMSFSISTGVENSHRVVDPNVGFFGVLLRYFVSWNSNCLKIVRWRCDTWNEVSVYMYFRLSFYIVTVYTIKLDNWILAFLSLVFGIVCQENEIACLFSFCVLCLILQSFFLCGFIQPNFSS